MSRTAVYGLTLYGSETYGYFIPPVYRVDPFTAIPYDYESITVSWNKPAGTILGYRLIKNMFGCPVDQDDGQVLLDITSGYPGGTFTDTNVTPGAYHYYGFYCLINSEEDEWVRSGFTGCLMPVSYDSNQYMMNLIPGFYIDSILGQNELVQDPVGNSYLSSFMEVLGWGFDYLRTQYDTYLNVNDPWKVPLNDLYNMGTQFNLDINPDIHPYTLRKAIYYNATVNQLRGTTSGISTELSALTGWNADITTGPNILLDNDQSFCADPSFLPWSQYIAYNTGEYVLYGNYWYQCIATGNYGTAPTGTSSSNTYWEAVLNTENTSFLYNPATNNVSTWETLYPLLSNGTYSYTPSLSLIQSRQGINLSSGTVSFLSDTVLNNTVAIMIMSTGGITVNTVEFDGIEMELIGTDNDTFVDGTDYWYVYYLTDAPAAEQFTITTTGSGFIYGYIYELANLGTPITTSWGATASQSSAFSAGGTSGSATAFFMAGMMDDSTPSISGGWTSSNAGSFGVGGYQIGSGIKEISGTFPGERESLSVQGVSCIITGTESPVPVIYEIIGVPDPLNTSDHAFNCLGATNLYVSATDLALRSISRTPADMQTVTTTFAPDKYQGMADGIPLPYLGFNEVWDATTVYLPEDVVIYSNQPFVALRESLNSVPPYASAGSSNQDWAPLSFENRVRVCISAYETASSAVAVATFVEWYDAGGNYITRVIARNPEAGSAGIPNQLCYDSFTVGAGNSLSARTTNDSGNSWTQQAGSWSVSPFADGCAYPTVPGSRSIATVNPGAANCQVGLTFDTEPQSGQSAGLVFRFSDHNNYFRADMSALKVRESGTLSTLGTYSTPFSVGDRMMIQLNRSVITILRNNSQVLQVTNSFNNTSTVHGIINENI